MKRHRLRVVKGKAEELEQVRDELVCPRCTDDGKRREKRLMVPLKTLRAGEWVHIGDACPECGFEYTLRDAPN